jgi:hypothetical protein
MRLLLLGATKVLRCHFRPGERRGGAENTMRAAQPASGVVEGITTFGFIAFFVFMASMGIAILLRQRRTAALATPG